MAGDTSCHATCAHLAPDDKAVSCARELRRGQILRPHMKMVVSSSRKGHAELPLALTHTWGGMLRGVLVGGATGAIAALLVGVLVAGGGPVQWTLVGLYAVLAAIMGCFAGGLVGSMNPVPKIDRMEKNGDVVVAVESTETRDLEWANRVLEKWGAHPEPMTHTA